MSDTPRTDFIVATSDYDGAIAMARILERELAEEKRWVEQTRKERDASKQSPQMCNESKEPR
jgi:hypothetical protein